MLTRRRERFNRLVHDASKMDTHALVECVRAKTRFTPLARVAALRVLIHHAPIEITRGAVYLQRRAFVREHFKV